MENKVEELIIKVIKSLKPRQYEALLRFVVCRESYQEIGSHLSTTIDRSRSLIQETFEKIIHRGKIIGVVLDQEIIISLILKNKDLLPGLLQKKIYIFSQDYEHSYYEHIELQECKPADIIDLKGLDLPLRARNCLEKLGITTIDQLMKMSDADLLHIKNLGKKHVRIIRQALNEYNQINTTLHMTNYKYE